MNRLPGCWRKSVGDRVFVVLGCLTSVDDLTWYGSIITL